MIDLIGWTLIHSLWQGGAIAAGLALLLSGSRRSAPSVRYALSLAALGLMVILPLVTALRQQATSLDGRGVSSTQGIAPTADATKVAAESPRQPVATPDRLVRRTAVPSADAAGAPLARRESTGSRGVANAGLAAIPGLIARGIDVSLPWLVAAWLVGLILLSIRLIGGLGRVTRLARDGTRPTSDYIRRTLQTLAERLGVRVAVRVLESARAQVPMVIGWMQPVILLPASALTGMTPRQLEMLLAHELAHIRRHDFAVNLVQTVIETLLFFHPAIWWISDRVREERENCCDDMAVAACDGDRATYTAALVALEERRGEAPGLATAATGGPLLRRVLRLIRGEPAHVDLGPRWFAGVITVLTALLTVGQTVQLAAEPLVPTSSAQFRETPKAGSTKSHEMVEWRDTTRARPDTVLRSPAGGTLAERWRWAEERSRSARFRTFWIGYVVEGDALAAQWYFFDRQVPVLSGDGTMTGRLRIDGGDPGGLIFPGVRLVSLVGNHAPNDIALFFAFESEGRGTPRLVRVHLGSFALPVYFDRMPLLWLGPAADAESVL